RRDDLRRRAGTRNDAARHRLRALDGNRLSPRRRSGAARSDRRCARTARGAHPRCTNRRSRPTLLGTALTRAALLELVLVDLADEVPPADAQLGGGFVLVQVGALEHFEEEAALQRVHRLWQRLRRLARRVAGTVGIADARRKHLLRDDLVVAG